MNQNLFTHIHIQLRHNGRAKFRHNVMTRVYVKPIAKLFSTISITIKFSLSLEISERSI